MDEAVLLIAHGSRRAEPNAELQWVAARLRERLPQTLVEIAFLEIAEPTITQGIARCVAGGARSVVLVPYFLSAGRHVREDLEKARQHAQGLYPHVRFHLAPALGPHELLVDLVMLRIRETVPNTPND